ncbi:MAG: CDP-alcohol phosphatidyltransferase family protein [Candidatus Aenigmarchaeota archaeon]|nr:CDP-alcohol phosphatidyltransferase family protein [Candidatus Aenigmarchaeota archaeon]
MTLYAYRQKFENLSVKIGRTFSKLELSPNQWTLLSILPGIISFYFLIEEQFFFAAIFFFCAGFIDIIDGAVARVMKRVSKFGAYIDTIVDRYVEFLIIFGLLFSNLPDFILPIEAWLFLLLFGGFLTTYSKAAAMEKKLVKMEVRGGILERGERLILMLVIILVAGFSKIHSVYLIALTAVLANTSAIQRFSIVFKLRKEFK